MNKTLFVTCLFLAFVTGVMLSLTGSYREENARLQRELREWRTVDHTQWTQVPTIVEKQR